MQNAVVSAPKKRILLFVTDLEVGGTPTVVRELDKRLTGQELEVEVACLGRFGPVAEQIQNDGGRVRAFDATVSRLPHAVRQLRGVVRERQIDGVLSFLVHANAVAALASTKLTGVRWLQSIQTTQPYPWWHWKLQGWAGTRAERLIAPSQGIVEAAGRLAGIASERFEIIPNAIDAADIVEAPRPPRDPESVLRVGFLGRLDPVKNVPALAAAVRRLEGVELHIFGEGPDRPRIEAAAAGDGRITLHGIVDRDTALGQVDALCLPSSAEGFGLVLIEAMAAGVPVVASDIPGIREVIEHEATGLLFDPPGKGGQAGEGMVAAIEQLQKEPVAAYRRAAAALRSVRERFTWERIVPRYRALFG